ncbi:receptor-like protein eix2 [Quercus suber]|uniref:Receptor-like protein eix2 n=1 Tax=Quercus suber TaxID=58331 RepID=A0AAW0M927_QUESU
MAASFAIHSRHTSAALPSNFPCFVTMAASFATLLHVLFLVWLLPATFSLSFFFFKAESISNVSCYEKDKQALLTLKRGLTDHEHVLSSWSDHKDCCIWDGVLCDKKIGRVTELNLNYSRLGGEISGSLLQLEHLNYLDLSGNDFNCTPIPTFLGSMYNLTHLDLSSANVCGLIPHQLGNLSSLRYLSLGNNSDLYVDNLRWMSGLSAIQHLDLNSADLHIEVDWLQIMSKFPSLSELYLRYCHLDSLNPSLGFVNFTSLRVLFLSGNHFNHEIPNWFSNLSTSLLRLDLYNSSLKGNIPPSIFNLEKLEYLELGLNYLNGPISSSFGLLSKLEFLSLYFNKLTEQIPEPLGQLKHLTFLDLGDNSLNGPIPSSVGNLSRMRSLYLDRNQLNGTIPKSLWLLSKLESLYVGTNSLTGTVDERHFQKLSKLKNLYMAETHLFFNVNSNWVPPFQLYYASMSSINIGPNFPSWLQSQKSLSILDMSMSGISGKAPSWFWNWASNITYINLSNNHIECDVSDIFLSSTVKMLNIANNSFYGTISTFLCQKKIRKNKLEVLDASNNLLSGELSHCWKYWQSLIHLNLGSNNLVGRIPYSMGALVNLQSLRLQNNSIYGDIPSSLKKCSNLRLIDMADNHLSIIPLWIGEMTNLLLQSFDALRYIGNPQLCGDPLPKSCTIEEQSLNRSPTGSVEDDSKTSSFYIGMGVGFATGFWAICGALFFNRTWRHAYFRFADEIKDWIYVTTMIKMNLLEKLRVCLNKEGMLIRQKQRSSMKWLVKPLLLINRSRSEKTFMLRLKVRHKNCLHNQLLLLVRVAWILLLAGMTNLLTILCTTSLVVL